MLHISDLVYTYSKSVRSSCGRDFMNCTSSSRAFFACFTNVMFTSHLLCLSTLLTLSKEVHIIKVPLLHHISNENDASVSSRFTEPLKTISCEILFVIIFGKIFDEILGFAAFIPKESVLSPICVQQQQQQRICSDRHYLLRLHILRETLEKSFFCWTRKDCRFFLVKVQHGLKWIGTDWNGLGWIGMDCDRLGSLISEGGFFPLLHLMPSSQL